MQVIYKSNILDMIVLNSSQLPVECMWKLLDMQFVVDFQSFFWLNGLIDLQNNTELVPDQSNMHIIHQYRIRKRSLQYLIKK